MANPTVDEGTPLLFESSGRAVKRMPLPTVQISIVLLILLCEPLASYSIFPYINQLITELGITRGDERKVGYYAGLIESLFHVMEMMTILQWGKISDRIGRKPILLVGLAGTVLSMLCFGLSRTFWTLLMSRCLCGLLNGNIGVVTSVIGELTDSTNRADGFAYISVVWSVGATIAPVIGGSLSHPYERFPAVYTSEFWKEFPYFLPCFAVAAFTFVCVLIMLLIFDETLSGHHNQHIMPPFSGTPTGDEKPLPLHKLLTYPVVLSVGNYFCISLMDIAFFSLLPLFMSTPVELGGLGCSPATIGYVLGALGAFIGIVQITFFPRLVRHFGERHIFIMGVLTITINCLLFPMISGHIRKNGVTWAIWCVFAFGLSLRAVTIMSYGCIYVYVNTSSPNKSSLGATNGVAQTMVSVTRALGPGLATSLFALSLEKNLLGGYAVYAALFIFSCISLVFAVHLPPQVWDEKEALAAERLARVWGNAPLHLTSLQPDLPRFHRGLLWTLDESGQSPTALSTLYDNPLPRPPSQEFRNEILSTISNYPHLFRIITPINVMSFQRLLRTHPNQPFVDSVLVGLREGFWPFANTHPDIYPLTYDASFRPPKTAVQRQFLIDQRNTEIACDRFSEPFGTDLLPGMYSMPIHSVPKTGTSKLRLVVDHSASDYSLNSMISRDDIAGARLDSIKDLADSLIQFRREHGSVQLVLFKSDVSAAYRRLPMHPLWQVKQIITVEGLRHVDRCNNFGNRAAQRLWVSFMALVTWIAIFVKNLDHLKLYTDDCYSFERATDFAHYEPYGITLPAKQVRLLELWDEIGVPHEAKKQVWGETLVIIGFHVDPNAMTVTMPPEKLEDLLLAIHSFCFSRHQTLRRFTQMAGWMNWALNVFPLLKPGLRALHEKINSKQKPDMLIYINPTVRFELSWFANHARRMSGVHIMESIAWRPSEADYVFFCAASLSGLGCYFPAALCGFQAVPPSSAPKENIFFLEALCVCWAIHIAHRQSLRGRLLFFTDNENTVAMFNRLYTPSAVYNPILLSVADVLIPKPFSIQIMTIPAPENRIADSLSRWQNAYLNSNFPEITIDGNEALPTLPSPPRDSLGWLSL